MNLIIKQIIVVIITFLLIVWFQNIDDAKNKRIRNSYYEKYKLPLLVSAIIGLILNFSTFFKLNNCVNENITEINIITPTRNDVNLCNSGSPNIKELLAKLEITTGLPDF
jgi:hypothetical protein